MSPRSDLTPKDGKASFVDLHTHVLPGVDDGPETWDEAVEILRQAASGGTALMVATPHGDDRRRWDNIDSLRHLCHDLNSALQLEQLPLSVVLGMENPVELDLADQVQRGAALTVTGSDYILVELPFLQLPLYWEEVLFQLQLSGLRPILAHPERQLQIQDDPELLAGAVSRGVMTQVTAGSIAGHFGPRPKKTAETLFKKDLVQIIASDCHRPEGSRGPQLLEGFRAAAKLIGLERATQMLAGVPGVTADSPPAT